MEEKLLFNNKQIEITIKRLVFELIENHYPFDNTAIIGLQPRGVFLSRKIKNILSQEINIPFLYGELDITFYRDDFRRGNEIHKAASSKIDFSVEDKKIILIDDVLFTGRTVRSAMDALADYGRPLKTELLTLIDRKFNRETPVQPDYIGKSIDTRGTDQKVKVEWEEGNDKIWLIKTTS